MDNMDLDGFLQTYVLGNPFQISSRPVNVQTEPQNSKEGDNTQAENCTNSQQFINPIFIIPYNGGTAVLKGNDLGIASTSGRTGSVESTPLNTSVSQSGGVSSELTSEEDNSPNRVRPMQVLGHAGSNLSASLLRKQRNWFENLNGLGPLKTWLQENYQLLSGPVRPMPMLNYQSFLEDVQKVFSDVQSTVISHVMTLAFPTITKLIVTKSGATFQGLIRKPQECSCTYISAALALRHSRGNEMELLLRAFNLSMSDDLPILCSLLYWKSPYGTPLDLNVLDSVCAKQGYKGTIDPLAHAKPEVSEAEVLEKRIKTEINSPTTIEPTHTEANATAHVQTESVSATSVQSEGVNAIPVNNGSVNTTRVNSGSVNAISVNSGSVNATPVKSESIDATPVKSESVNITTVQSGNVSGRKRKKASPRRYNSSSQEQTEEHGSHENFLCQDSTSDESSASDTEDIIIDSRLKAALKRYLASDCDHGSNPEIVIEKAEDKHLATLHSGGDVPCYVIAPENSCDENRNSNSASDVSSKNRRIDSANSVENLAIQNQDLKTYVRFLLQSQKHLKKKLENKKYELKKMNRELNSVKKQLKLKGFELSKLNNEFSSLNDNFDKFGSKLETICLD